MSCGGDDVRIRERTWVFSGTYETSDVGDIGEKDRSDRIGDFAEFFEVDFAGIGRSAGTMILG